MKHLEALRLLPRYFEAGLDRETTRALHEHLKTCSDCRDQIKLMRDFQKRKHQGRDDENRAGDRRRSRLSRPGRTKVPQVGFLNAHHLAADRRHQRRLVFQFVVAAALFFLAVRFGLFEYLFR